MSSARQSRPNLPAGECPFCPGGIEAPEPYDVRWFANRWPSLPDGRAEVVLYTPDHDTAFWSLGVAGAEKVVRLWAERTAVLGSRPDVGYVLVFENRGPQIGATITHPHGQIYAFDAVPPVPRTELASGSCCLCGAEPGTRLVTADGGWRAWVPDAPAWPFELLLAPLDHVPDLPAIVDGGPGARSLGRALVDALERLDRLFDEAMPYMLWFHQRPTDGEHWPTAHVHAHLAPVFRKPGTMRYVAAGELGSGVYFNPVDPEEAAERLRGAVR
ncbi:MAG: galactose-1-phosphate uridylyltransferase [Actinomycetota bacterium]|nr:galactose-1-phosphate uridylyltransferase [Actinomycetota bacterium]